MTKKGSITSAQAIYVPTDDLADPVLPLPLPIWMLPLCWSMLLLSWASTQLWILWIPLLESWIPVLLEMSIMMLPMGFKRSHRTTDHSRTSLPSWIWRNLLNKTSWLCPMHGKYRVSCVSHYRLLKFSYVIWGSWYLQRRPSKDPSRFWQVNMTISQNRTSICWDPLKETMVKADKLTEEHWWGGHFGKLSTHFSSCPLFAPNQKIAVCSVGHMRSLTEDIMFCLRSTEGFQ